MERLKKLFIISLIISIIVLVLVTVFTIGPDTLPTLQRMEPVYLLAAAALHVVSYFIWGLRMKVMTEALGHRIGVKDATEIVIANLFAASVTPSMAGGEPVRIHMLNRNANVPVGDASAVVIGERILDALLLLIATPFALWVLSGSLISREMDLAIIGAELFVLLMVFVAIGGLLNPTFIDWLSSLISRGLHRVGRFDRTEHLIQFIDKELLNFHNSLWAFMRTGKQGLFFGCICTMIYWIVEFMVLPLILLGLNQPPSITVAMAVQVFLTFIMIVPVTPGASGIAELGGAALFGILVPVSILGIVVAAWRLITYYLNLVIGGAVSVKILKDVDILSEWNSK
ncbi:MAG: flippase-like domain-containing protein [ANME-2 cluster archaeon]|nr:flippase-like domain-containing protein [ANME-2 cluster archaeon]MBC2700833.1 flippase-like domain-containing protein [ANME-2 cluster archaeon]MBC2706946.1 flippase-like domain-containing protein [ANME-2 cluster archaeon]MBC2746008.1 flippase-like domain-containing protein [ANME-2 cluster archaeon]MBC2762156.1 flippase-like domain-containing protein [ANME-2 cluster archaeon]